MVKSLKRNIHVKFIMIDNIFSIVLSFQYKHINFVLLIENVIVLCVCFFLS